MGPFCLSCSVRIAQKVKTQDKDELYTLWQSPHLSLISFLPLRTGGTVQVSAKQLFLSLTSRSTCANIEFTEEVKMQTLHYS